MREGRLQLAVLGAIVVAAVALRLVDLFAPMRYDEAFSFLFYASSPIRTGLSDYGSPTNHLLNTLLMHFSWRGLGNHPWALRLPALLAGIALVPAMYAAGRALYNRHAGLIAAALAAGSVVFVQYSVDGRGYGPAALFFVSAIAVGAHALRTRSRRAWAGFAACCVLAFYSAAFMALAVLVLLLWVILEVLAGRPPRPIRERVPLLREAALAVAAVVLASLLLYAPTLGDPGWDYPYVEPLETLSQQWELAERTWGQWQRQMPLPVWPILVAASVAGAVFHRRVSRVRVPLLLPAALGVLGAVVVGPFAPFPKHWIWLLPVFFLVSAAGLAAAVERAAPRLRMSAAALASAVAVVLFVALAAGYLAAGTDRFLLHLERPGGANDMALFVGERHPGRPVLARRAHLVGSYYFRRDGVPGLTTVLARQQSAARRTLVLTWSSAGEGPLDVVRHVGARAAPGSRPVLVRRWRWVALWEVRLAG